MKSPYRYRNLTYKITDQTELFFTVEFLSDGNAGVTNINIPGMENVEIADAGTKRLGLAADLKGRQIISFSNIYNVVPEETEIAVQFKINDSIIAYAQPTQLEQPHSNLKSVSERPEIVLFITLE